jgi:beta-lactamase regulating signal transducer with metallopeptidase domain
MTSFIVSLAIRLTVVMLAGGLVAVALRHSTYAVRHVIVATTLACAIALPPLMILIPEWRVGVLPSDTSKMAITRTRHVTVTASPHAPAPATVPASQQTIRPVLVTSALDSDTQQAQSATATFTVTPRAPFTPSLAQLTLGIWVLGVLFGLAWIALGRFGLARVRRRATPLV